MNPKRITRIKPGIKPREGQYVLYWMQQAQRVHYNHALEHAITIANLNNLPVLVYFGLTANYPDANIRHYQFMLEGLREVQEILLKFHINFVLKLGSPEKSIVSLLDQAYALIMDQGYLKHQVNWRKKVVETIENNMYQMSVDIVDTDLIVPVHIASTKAEYGAYTLRPKIKKLFQEFRDFTQITPVRNQTSIRIDSDDDLSNIKLLLKKLDLDHVVEPSAFYKGGYLEASRHFFDFITYKAENYLNSNDPSTNYTSLLSMYLHFGQISSLEILERMTKALHHGQIEGEVYDAYIEQLLVRRELAFNYVTYQKGYDQFDQMTEPWAYMTMNEHALDQREYLYNEYEIEHSQTHDPYFNAAMKEMFYTGYMHNYMRMYWAKKIIEWTSSHEIAYKMILKLNNKYFIDGRDPNSYASIAWCFGKHDRAWTERSIFGKLRYMNAAGLERKFNISGYIDKVEEMVLEVTKIKSL